MSIIYRDLYMKEDMELKFRIVEQNNAILL